MSQIWFITGASSGLGEALTKAVIDSGDKVAATFRKASQAQAFSQQYGANGLGLVMDVTDAFQVQGAVEQAMEHFGRLDVVVNNAGYGTIGAIEEFSMEEIRQQMETNFFGALAVTKKAIPALRKNNGGYVIQISSAAGFRAMGGFGLYNASKFALEGFSEALAQEVAAFNIKVVIVEPGPFRTQFAGSSVKKAAQRMDEYNKTPVEQMYTYIDRVDGKQEGDPNKAAKVIVDYVHNNQTALRLPLGKSAVQAIKSKLAAVQADLTANETLSMSTQFEE